MKLNIAGSQLYLRFVINCTWMKSEG